MFQETSLEVLFKEALLQKQKKIANELSKQALRKILAKSPVILAKTLAKSSGA